MRVLPLRSLTLAAARRHCAQWQTKVRRWAERSCSRFLSYVADLGEVVKDVELAKHRYRPLSIWPSEYGRSTTPTIVPAKVCVVCRAVGDAMTMFCEGRTSG